MKAAAGNSTPHARIPPANRPAPARLQYRPRAQASHGLNPNPPNYPTPDEPQAAAPAPGAERGLPVDRLC
ncbi:MAG: hypothetical protein JXQ71_05080 [Verrucomicrobia bacterium]|nr:hypothetical protein [Verrucomicrobiota bacterium]